MCISQRMQHQAGLKTNVYDQKRKKKKSTLSMSMEYLESYKILCKHIRLRSWTDMGDVVYVKLYSLHTWCFHHLLATMNGQ